MIDFTFATVHIKNKKKDGMNHPNNKVIAFREITSFSVPNEDLENALARECVKPWRYPFFVNTVDRTF